MVSRVGIIGARGISNYGGFETVVGELAPRLAAMGYEVYCSHRRLAEGAMTAEFKGVKVLYFPFCFPAGHRGARLFEVLYDWYFLFKCAFVLRCDIVYCLGVASGPFLIATRLTRTKTCVNVDGLEWRRRKFGLADKAYLKLAFTTSCAFSNVCVLDNSQLKGYLDTKVVGKSAVIPYGVNSTTCGEWDGLVLEKYLEKGEGISVDSQGFLLVVARLEPENNIDVIVKAYSSSECTSPLLVVGDFSSPAFEEEIMTIANSVPEGKRVLFTGSIFNRGDLEMLRCHCSAYIHGHSVGGTNPSLLEAMSAGDLIIAHDNVFNKEVCGDSALFFSNEQSLREAIDIIGTDSSQHRARRDKALDIVRKKYGWEDITSAYDKLFKRLSNG